MSIGKKISFWQFINSESIKKIEIPELQRDYVQGRNDEKVQFSLDRLLEDLYRAIYYDERLDLNYVYGKINNDDTFIPVDGQQRLTTLLSLHIYSFSVENKQDELKILSKKFEYKTRVTTDRFLKSLMKNLKDYFIAGGKEDIEFFIMDSAWFSSAWLKDPSVKSFLCVLKKIDELFKKSKFSDKLTCDNCPITYMGLSIQDMGNENDLYIKMNARGKALTQWEIFKSDLFDFIDDREKNGNFDKNFCLSFKVKADTEWTNLIWKTYEQRQKEWDMRYLKLFHYLILNHIAPPTAGNYDDSINGVIKNKGEFYNFVKYKPLLKDLVVFKKIRDTFNFLAWLSTASEDLFKTVIKQIVVKVETFGPMRERVILFAITKYANQVKSEDWSEVSFFKWYRIITNLVRNTEIDKEARYCAACDSVDKFPQNCLEDAIKYFAGLQYKNSGISFFDGSQIDEEIEKARLINNNVLWEKPIIKAEEYEYFDHRIAFMFLLQDLDKQKLPTDNQAVENFKENWDIIAPLFTFILSSESGDSLFRRAMLTYGDYSIMANANKTFYFEGGNEYFNWNKMLRNDSSFAIFKQMFEEIKLNKTKSLEEFFKEKIDNYTSDNKFLYYLVKIPQIFDFMREKRYIEDENRNRIILYKKARLSAKYAEFYTFVLYRLLSDEGFDVEYFYGTGYLTAETSYARIEKINDIPLKVEFYNNNFYLQEQQVGQRIEDVLELLKNRVLQTN